MSSSSVGSWDRTRQCSLSSQNDGFKRGPFKCVQNTISSFVDGKFQILQRVAMRAAEKDGHCVAMDL
jgi:hypothetical protein